MNADEPPALVAYSGNGKQVGKSGGKKRLAITSGDVSDGSMPSLQTVSDSSEDTGSMDESEGGEEFGEDESDDEDSDFDEEFEDHIRDMVREAMDIAQADPDFNDPRAQASVFEDMSADKKDNPFLKLLGSLRGVVANSFSVLFIDSLAGRLFSGSTAMKTTDRAQPREPYTGSKPPPEAYKPVSSSAKATGAKKTKGWWSAMAQ